MAFGPLSPDCATAKNQAIRTTQEKEPFMSSNTAPRRALVVIDVQNEYFEGGGLPIEYPPVAQSLPKITQAMDAAHAACRSSTRPSKTRCRT
jgi:hypothetical protein